MPAALVTLGDLNTFLGGAIAAENTLRQNILDRVEALFVAQCGRTAQPFAPSTEDRIERQRGTGSAFLHLDYPISDVTTVKLGYDSSDPDETLDPDDKTVLVWDVGGQQLTRVDGGWFGPFGVPSYVQVTYDTQDDLPEDAGLAVLRVAAAVYWQRGSEDVTSETIGGQTSSLAQIATSDTSWTLAVEKYRREALL